MIFYTLWYFIVWLKERWFKGAVNCAGLIWIYGFFIKTPSVWWFFLAESLFLCFLFFFVQVEKILNENFDLKNYEIHKNRNRKYE